MEAGDSACVCSHCDSVCEGKFKACSEVWARGPRPVEVRSSAVAAGPSRANGHVNSSPSWPTTAPPVNEGRAAAGHSEATNAGFSLLDRPEASTQALRAELAALSTAMTHQQAVVTQLIGAYGDLRRTPDNESMLAVVEMAVEHALAEHEAERRDVMARTSRRSNELFGQLDDLAAGQRAHAASLTTLQDELRNEFRNASSRGRAALDEALAAGSDRMDNVLGQVKELAKDQRAHHANQTTAQEELRSEVARALGRERAALSEALAAVTERMDALVGGVAELTTGQQSHQAHLTTAQDEMRTQVAHALGAERAALSDALSAVTERMDALVGRVGELTAHQQAQKADLTTGYEDLRTDVADALRHDRAALSEALAQSAGLVSEAVGEVRGLATELSASTIREVRDAKAHATGLFVDMQKSLARLEKSAGAEREGTREVLEQWLKDFGESIGDVVAAAVAQAVKESEGRTTERLETAVGQFGRSLNDTEEAWARHRLEAAEAEARRLQELSAHLVKLDEGLRGTHALAAAQQEETELLDAAMRTLQEWMEDMAASVATQHQEIREHVARQQRASNALIKRQFRPITESLPELVADAVQQNEEQVLRRIERAVAKVRRSLEKG